MTARPRINSIATAVPAHDIHADYIDWADRQVAPERRALWQRMVGRAGIVQRWSVIDARPAPFGADGFYGTQWPGTAERMRAYADAAPDLAEAAVRKLEDYQSATHVVLASCTGFVAPGIDQILVRRLGLSPSVERVLVGFMGCYAAVTALRQAYHIVRSVPAARVLVVNVELCTLHLQATDDIETLLAMLLFGDGASAAWVKAEGAGLALDRPYAVQLADSADLITWDIVDTGFAMHLSGKVPGRIADALADSATRDALLGDTLPERFAVHAGGRSILDAVEKGFALPEDALATSRDILSRFGNMSSATLMFVLEAMLAKGAARPERGTALAFGPGLAAEGIDFQWTAA